ncbi:hypothetical protein [Candidatus Thiosymbion oneisti]|uniref:hypothetical protein n=1 Tax=Candidatus Thiosymbion oneisti TaxID=589554 RepID=UPI00105D1D93|nr:hypothetical protein [Candidatus Thiosymbion oneisti]
MQPPNCGHCLRPAQTSRIARELLEQCRPINLIGGRGQGRARLLDDLMGIDPDIFWLYADLKEHRYRFAGLLETLWDQTGLVGYPPSTLGGLVDKLTAGNRPVCLLLHHFDAILDNPDPNLDAGFDAAFLDTLNALKNRGVSLLCVTRRAYDPYGMLTRSGERRGSTLVLEPEALAPLSQAEIRAELDRCLPGLDANDLDLLAASLLRHRHPLSFLGYVRRRLRDGDVAAWPFDERLSHWEDKYWVRYGGLTTADAVAPRHRIRSWYRALFGRIKPLSTGPIKQLGRRLAGKD